MHIKLSITILHYQVTISFSISDQPERVVVEGPVKGQVGEVINRDKAKYRATVQLIMSEEVLVLDYDSVCDYAGEVPDLD